MSKQLLMHGEPDAWKPACPVRGMEKLVSARGIWRFISTLLNFQFSHERPRSSHA